MAAYRWLPAAKGLARARGSRCQSLRGELDDEEQGKREEAKMPRLGAGREAEWQWWHVADGSRVHGMFAQTRPRFLILERYPSFQVSSSLHDFTRNMRTYKKDFQTTKIQRKD
ncbi:hypothetical protein GUJ93_ZPchr0006g44565 [Zizania palustris]|uniref:Uncharacterized protein n=1 Tax=Zizania palustris TaxID=103762 RepID=A0A8J5STJ5_ZIZPA|nr:hypothetical protein GUJ93_ZPchr0006g44565 [Zizania palustris]